MQMPGSAKGPSAWVSRALDYRGGRTIAVSRLVMIVLFAIALWADPIQPLRTPDFVAAVLAWYTVQSVILVAIAWRSWWYDHLLAAAAFAADALAFFAALTLTQGLQDDFFSPFMVFYAFLLISANVRWGWRTALALGCLISLGFGGASFLLQGAGIPIDEVRVVRRVVYMLLLGGAVAWFAAQYAGNVLRRHVPFRSASAGSLLDEALDWAIGCSGAACGAIAWADTEEPRLQVRTQAVPQSLPAALPPDALDLEHPALVALFDTPTNRALFLDERGNRAALGRNANPGLARLCGIDHGLVVPLKGSTGSGQLVLCGISGMSADHLRLAAALGEDCTFAMDRAQLAAVQEQAMLARMRNSVARDLHDSVAQSLAGASFRLAALATKLRADLPAGSPAPDAVSDVQASIAGEQAHVRDMIERLRQEEYGAGSIDLSRALPGLCEQLARQWDITIETDIEAGAQVPAMVAFEMQNLVREAVANAVRHGQARRMELLLERGRDGTMLTIADDGTGFAGSPARPRSLAERVEALGGALVISSQANDTRLVITLPTGPQ